MEQSQPSTVAIATNIAVLLVAFASCPSSVAAIPEVCVLAPRIEPAISSGLPQALVPLAKPTIFIREPLAELRFEQGDRKLWTWETLQEGSTLEGPVPWPLAPLHPGQSVMVRLRPLGANPDHFASFQLQAAPRQRLQEGDRLLRSLIGHPAAWRPAIEKLLNQGDPTLATALLFAHEGPQDPELDALRRLVAQASCP